MALIEGVGGAPGGACEAGGLASVAEPPEQLLRAIDAGDCFLFAGEGLPQDCGLPSWSRYLIGLIDHLAGCRAITGEEAVELRALWSNGRYDLAAQSIRAMADRADHRAAQYARRVYSRAVPVSDTLAALAKIGFCAAVTPNVDALIERVMECECFGPRDALAVEDRIAESVPFVLKLRGSAGQRSLRVWHDLAVANMPADCGEALCELFRTRSMLAIGVSADDLREWLDAAGITHADRTHFLIASPSDCELKRKAEALYRRFHVRVLVAADDEVLPFLQKLSPHHKLSS